MKLEPVIKLDKINTTTSKKIDDDVMSVNCEIIVIFPIYGQSLQTSRSQIPDAWSIKLTFSLTITFYLAKTESRTKNL